MARARLHGHPRAPLRRGLKKKWDGSGGQAEQALGRSRGGFGTEVHGAITGLGPPARLILTPGQAADAGQAEAPIDGLPVEVVIADKGYDSKAVVAAIESRGAEAVIPSLSNPKVRRPYDRDRYRDREPAERSRHRAERSRRVATRYEETARNFLAFAHVASIMILLRQPRAPILPTSNPHDLDLKQA